MKATINGITVEGTPQEIMEYQKLVEFKIPSGYGMMIGTTNVQSDNNSNN